MDLNFTAEELAFRSGVRQWVAENLPKDLSHKVHNALRLSRDDMQRWAKILGAKGWLGWGWPKEFGGPGWNAVQKHLFEEECALAGAPRVHVPARREIRGARRDLDGRGMRATCAGPEGSELLRCSRLWQGSAGRQRREKPGQNEDDQDSPEHRTAPLRTCARRRAIATGAMREKPRGCMRRRFGRTRCAPIVARASSRWATPHRLRYRN